MDAIGKPEVRTAETLRTGQGTATLELLSGATGYLSGTSTVASMGKKFNFLMYFNAPAYTGEQFKFDGSTAFVADNDQARFQRVNLAFFMYRHEVILKEGLWGGIWNAAWPLYDLAARSAELKYEGLKKVDGKKLLEYRYIPKHAERELTVHLVFDPETFRHVQSVYEITGPVGNVPALTVSETFGDFRDERGLMLPHSWDIRYEPDQAGAYLAHWKVTLNNVKVTSVNASAAPPKKQP